MTRAYAALAGSNLLVLLGAMILGYSVKDQRTINMHVALALFAAMLTCFVHVITFTYMVVMGKLTRQAVELGNLDRGPRWKLDRLKAGIAAGLALGMVATVVAVATGAVTLRSAGWHWLHQIAAWLALGVNGAVFYAGLDRVHHAGKVSKNVFEQYNQAKPKVVAPPWTASNAPPERDKMIAEKALH